ncbi:DUF350 domain-containing protein [Cellvibrio sp. NN19]|uniref:DUF350 domain-containing protein n=1 Tax=Cellvibrio chitinivorans TaxID=3102792 RepID=UPI002B41048E|nr:DUF350 domain-containing protein [Cellvibrio sp. NN19]
MLATTLSSLNGIPSFLAYFAVAIVLVLIFVRIYTWITPQDELALIRANNSAASLAFGGALIGFALPLSSAITHSQSLLDCAVWGAVALIVQVLTFVVLRISIKQLPERITKGEVATGAFAGACAIAVGLINAASMSY